MTSELHPLPTAKPEEMGIPTGAISNFLDALDLTGLCMHGLIIVRKGHIVTEGYWKPFDKDSFHRMYSCSKSIVSIAIGFMADEGLISLDDPIVKYFPEKLPLGLDKIHPYLAETTIRHMLMMASPHSNTTYTMHHDVDWVKTFFTAKPSHKPGTIFRYDTSASHTLGALVGKLTGQDFLDYLRPRLLEHIGFSPDTYCVPDPMGVPWGGSGVVCTTRDFAKLALTCMQGGRYQGRQLIPEWYIREAVSPQISNFLASKHTDSHQGYGYQFWRLRNNGFSFRGMGAQLALCLPDKDFMLVTTADTQWQGDQDATILNALWDKLYPYLSDEALPDNVSAVKALTERLDNLSIPTVEGRFYGPANVQTYLMDDNKMGISALRLSFQDGGGTLHLTKESGDCCLRFGYGVNIPQVFPEYGYDSIISGAWADDNTLNLWVHIIGDHLGMIRANLSFCDDAVTLHMEKVAEGFLENYSGIASGTVQP